MGLNILIVDDEANIRKTLSMALEVVGHKVTTVSNGKDGLLQASMNPIDLVFLDLRLGTEKGMDYLPEFIATSPWIKIVVVTAYASVETAVEAMKLGAVDYLPKPFTPIQVQSLAARLAETKKAEQEVAAMGPTALSAVPGMDLDSRSPGMQKALTLARKAAPTEAMVLIRGESGTGKSVLARLIHSWSPRASFPFGVLSCPSLSPDLLNRELFGYVQGAFAGALRDYPGRIASNQGGTLFMDEIGDLPLEAQFKMLRFLQNREFEKVGDAVTRKADMRFLATSTMNLEVRVKEGRFREDLFYHLQAFQIDLPPLRERGDDISNLAHRFLAHYAGKNQRQFFGFSAEALDALATHPWPGNIRELKSTIERATIVCRGSQIGVADLGLQNPEAVTERIQVGEPVSLDRLEEAHIRHILASTKQLDEAARILGIDAATLWRRRKKYGI